MEIEIHITREFTQECLNSLIEENGFKKEEFYAAHNIINETPHVKLEVLRQALWNLLMQKSSRVIKYTVYHG